MDKKVFIHTFWGLFTASTFWVGTLLAPSSIIDFKTKDQRAKNEETPNQRGVSLSLVRGSGKLIPSKQSSSSDLELEVLPRGLAGRAKSSSSSVNRSSIFESPSKRPPLSKAEIKTLVDLAIKSSDPIERRRAFDRLLEEMKSDSFTYEQAMSIRIAMHKGGANGDQWRTFDYAWGANDPASAIKEIDNIPEQYRRGFTSNMLPGLASVEPQTAIGIVEAMDGEMRQQMTGRLIEGLADYDINFATDYVMEMAENGDPNIAQHMKRLAKEVMETTGLEGGLDWVGSLEEGALQATALRSVANEYANEMPEEAAKWAEQFIGNDQNSRIFGEIVREWGDQEAASAWVDSLEPSQGQKDAISAVYGFKGARTPEQALQEIQAMPQSANKDFALNGFISGLAGQDGEAAVAWASEITMPGMRESAMVRAAKQYYKQDSSATQEWFVSSGLPVEAWYQISGTNPKID